MPPLHNNTDFQEYMTTFKQAIEMYFVVMALITLHEALTSALHYSHLVSRCLSFPEQAIATDVTVLDAIC